MTTGSTGQTGSKPPQSRMSRRKTAKSKKWPGVASTILVVLLVAVIVLAALFAFRACSENETVLEATTTTAEETTTITPPTTVPEATTTSITLAGVVGQSDAESGDLLVSELKVWSKTFNAGDLVQDSYLLSFFTSETKAFTDLAVLKENAGTGFVEELNAQYDPLRADYWQKAPTAAANMLTFLAKEKPWLLEVAKAVAGTKWAEMSVSAKMSLIDELTWTTTVQAPASFRTTGGDNKPAITDPGFRAVYKAQNVVISPDDPAWQPTLVDCFLPSIANKYLKDHGSDAWVREVQKDDVYVIEIVKGDSVVTAIVIDNKVSVPVIILNSAGKKVVAEAVFSTVCGNPTLPEFSPPSKERATTTTAIVTTTTRSTTITKPPSTTTTTRPPSTTTTKPPSTTTTTRPPSTTTTTTSSTITTSLQPKTTTPTSEGPGD